MNVGETSNLVATVKPENAQNKNVKWTSSNENIATVNEEGIITAVAEGEAKITVTTLDGNYTAECNVTVKKHLTQIMIFIKTIIIMEMDILKRMDKIVMIKLQMENYHKQVLNLKVY